MALESCMRSENFYSRAATFMRFAGTYCQPYQSLNDKGYFNAHFLHQGFIMAGHCAISRVAKRESVAPASRATQCAWFCA